MQDAAVLRAALALGPARRLLQGQPRPVWCGVGFVVCVGLVGWWHGGVRGRGKGRQRRGMRIHIYRHLLDHVEGVGDDPVLWCVRGWTRVYIRGKKNMRGAQAPIITDQSNVHHNQPDSHARARGEQARGHGLPHLQLLVRVARVLAPHHLVDDGLEVEHGRLCVVCVA